MATQKRRPQTVVLDSTEAEETASIGVEVSFDENSEAGADSGIDASLCPSCGEPLAWHEAACIVQGTSPQPAGSDADETPKLTTSAFAYALGQPVQPDPDAPARPVIWRGQLKARHPRTGLVHRVNVYRLDNDYWDCYYEAELQAA